MIVPMNLRQRKIGSWVLWLAFVSGLLSISSGFGANGKPVELVTAQEAATPERPPGHIEAGKEPDDGPIVEIVAPEKEKSYKPPVPVVVKFIPRNGREIDVATLKVEYLKSWSIDLTYKVLPYATKDGINIAEADLPSGKHRIQISIADISGATTRVIMFVSVI